MHKTGGVFETPPVLFGKTPPSFYYEKYLGFSILLPSHKVQYKFEFHSLNHVVHPIINIYRLPTCFK